MKRRSECFIFAWLAGFTALFLVDSTLACTADPLSGLDLVSGKSVSIDPKVSARGTVVVFLSAKCPCSKSHEAVLSQLVKDFPEFQFVGVHSNSDEEVKLSRMHFQQSELAFPVIQDENSRLANAFEANKTPHVFVVSPDGKCLFTGGVDNSKNADEATKPYLRLALTDIQEGRPPKEPTVRALGCIIKR